MTIGMGETTTQVEVCEQTIDSDEEGMIAALAKLGATQAEQFITRLDWTVSDDMSLLDSVRQAENPASAFQTSGWFDAWIESCESRPDLRLVSGRLGSTVLVVVPLEIIRRNGSRLAQPLAQQVSDYNQPILHPAVKKIANGEFMAALWRHAGGLLGVDCLSLRKLLARPAVPARGSWWGKESHGAHQTVYTGDWRSIESQYWSKKARYKLSLKRRKIEAFGEVRIRRLTNVDERIAGMDCLCGWKRQQLETLGPANRFAHGELPAFLNNLAAAGDPDIYRLYGIFAGPEPLAVTFLIACGKRWVKYQTAFTSEKLGYHSPGMILLRDIMRDASEDGVEIFDFGMGDEAYKQRYCEVHIDLYRAEIPYTVRGRARALMAAAESRLHHLVKDNPRAKRVAASVLRMSSAIIRQR